MTYPLKKPGSLPARRTQRLSGSITALTERTRRAFSQSSSGLSDTANDQHVRVRVHHRMRPSEQYCSHGARVIVPSGRGSDHV